MLANISLGSGNYRSHMMRKSTNDIRYVTGDSILSSKFLQQSLCQSARLDRQATGQHV